MLGHLLVHHDDSTGAVRQLAGVTRRHHTARQSRPQPHDAFIRGASTNTFVIADRDLFAHQAHDLVDHAHGDGDRRDFILEQAFFQGGSRFLLAGRTVLVHGFTTNAVTLGHLFGGLQHGPVHLGLVLVQPRVDQHVLVHFLHGAGNGFHATSHINVALVGNDALRGHGNGLQARGTKTVDGHARDTDRAACAQGDLASDVGASGALGLAAAHDDVVHFGGINTGALNGVFDRMTTHGGAVGHIEGTLPAFGQGRAGSGNNYSSSHG